MNQLRALLTFLLLFQAGGSQTLQAEVKATPDRANVKTGTASGSAQPASRTESSAVNFAGTFTFAGEPKPTGYPNPVTRLANTAFLVAYDEMRENPVWAAYRIPGKRIYGTLPRPARFATDTRTKARVTHSNYTLTGYDRGHIVPNLAIASRFGVEAQAETFLMSNIVPQKPALNQGPWRLLEETLSETTAIRCTDIWVIVGPIYEGPVKKLPSGSVVPSAFFMLIADETAEGPRLQAFIMPQTTKRGANFRDFRTSVREVQAKTGLDFYWELPDALENRLEGERAEFWLE
jgi:endonuclease G